MNKLTFGLFALFVLLGNHFGSMFGVAVAVCVFMIADGLIEELRKLKTQKNNPKKGA